MKDLAKRRWTVAVPLARSAVRLAQAPVPPIGSIALAVSRFPPPELMRCGARWRIVTVFGCRRSQFSARNGPPASAPGGQVWVNARTLPLRGARPWPFR